MSTEEEMEMIDQLLTQEQSGTQGSSGLTYTINTGMVGYRQMQDALRQSWANTTSSTSSNEWSGWLETNGQQQINVTPTPWYDEQEAKALSKFYTRKSIVKEQEPESFNFFKALKLTK